MVLNDKLVTTIAKLHISFQVAIISYSCFIIKFSPGGRGGVDTFYNNQDLTIVINDFFYYHKFKKNLHSTDDRFVATCIWYLLYLAWNHPKHTLNSNSHSLTLYFEIYIFQQYMRTNYIQYIYIH